VVVCVKKWVPKAAVQAKLLKRFRVEKAKAHLQRSFTLHESRVGRSTASTGPFWHGQSCTQHGSVNRRFDGMSS